MKITFTGRHIDVTPALKESSTEKLSHLEKIIDHILHVDVIFSVENITQIAEANVHIKGKTFNAKEGSDDMYASIDLLSKNLETQLRKYKDKLIDSHH